MINDEQEIKIRTGTVILFGAVRCLFLSMFRSNRVAILALFVRLGDETRSLDSHRVSLRCSIAQFPFHC